MIILRETLVSSSRESILEVVSDLSSCLLKETTPRGHLQRPLAGGWPSSQTGALVMSGVVQTTDDRLQNCRVQIEQMLQDVLCPIYHLHAASAVGQRRAVQLV